MLSQMKDSAHDKEHIYRVLNYALQIAEDESNVNYELLKTAALLHDIGRTAQFADSSIDHAAYGADLARDWLMSNGLSTSISNEKAQALYQLVGFYKLGETFRWTKERAKLVYNYSGCAVCAIVRGFDKRESEVSV